MASFQRQITRLEGRVAIVVASTQGIGFAIAQRLAQEGAKVVICSRRQKNVDEAVNKLKSKGHTVVGVVCHVSNANQRQKLFEAAENLGGLDILISNAAVNPQIGPLLDTQEAVWDKIFDVNLKAGFLLMKEALPLLRKSSAGRIIFISSGVAYSPTYKIGAYAVSKVAQLGLTKQAAVQLARENITVNCIAPGYIETHFGHVLFSTEELKKRVTSSIPLSRIGLPNDVSGVAAFLASDDASYITGEIIVVSGGLKSRL